MAEENQINIFKFGNQDLPVFREVKNKDWIYYGTDNDYPYYLIDLYSECAYHKAVIDGKVAYICGSGWSVKTDGMSTEQKALAARILNQPFGIPNLNEATVRWAMDEEIFNGIAVHGVWSNDKKAAELKFIDFANIRSNADQTKFYYSAKWVIQGADGKQKVNPKPNEEKDFKVFEPYDPSSRTGEFIYYWKEPHPTQKVYPIPGYQGSVRWINIDISLAKYFHNIVTNGFVPTHIINFYNGEPTQEKSKAIEKMIKEKWSGVSGQPIIVNFAKNKESAADVQTLQMTDADKQYQEVSKQAEQKIFTSHRAPKILFSITTEGALGQRTEAMFFEEHFQNAYVTGRQQILENIINMFSTDFGLGAIFKLNRVRRVGYMFSDATIDAVVTPEEKRVMILEQLGIKPQAVAQKNAAVELLKNLSSMSPLVANKVLDSLSPSEIRDMVGLPPAPLTTVTNTTTQFSAQEDEACQAFEAIAKDYSKSTLLYEREVENFDDESILKSEQEFMSMHFAENIKANALERSIIDLLSKDPTTQPEAIAKATKTDVGKVKSTIESLVERKILKSSSIKTPTDSVEGYEVSESGYKALDEKPAKTAKIKVVYRYGLSLSFKNDPELLESSHPFCKKMIGLSKSGKRWESEDIFLLNNMTNKKYGMNAWTNRGGWYTKPNTEIHVPHCRHSWIQEIRSVITD